MHKISILVLFGILACTQASVYDYSLDLDQKPLFSERAGLISHAPKEEGNSQRRLKRSGSSYSGYRSSYSPSYSYSRPTSYVTKSYSPTTYKTYTKTTTTKYTGTSYPGGYASSTYLSPTSTMYYKKYTTYPQTTVYVNSYWNANTGRTYYPLYAYYRPVGYFNAIGYYSTLYLLIYYDGYGYNFYYGAYGYY